MTKLAQIRRALKLLNDAENSINKAEELISVPDGLSHVGMEGPNRIDALRKTASEMLAYLEKEAAQRMCTNNLRKGNNQ